MTMDIQREEILSTLGASGDVLQELMAYGASPYDWTKLPSLHFPWPDEPYAPFWETYAEECNQAGSIAPLSNYLVQLRFPVAEGMSRSEDYRAATKRVVAVEGLSAATGLQLRSPERCRVLMHPTPAGRIPIVVAGDRADFVALVQALTDRNEPVPVPKSMGAVMVSGYNNLHRIRLLRDEWQKKNPQAGEAEWSDEFGHIVAQPALYRDRFILVSEGPYSNTFARELGLTDGVWLKTSLAIRLDHECTHYFVRRAFPGTRFQKTMHEEVVADYAGIVAANGSYRADWFLRFIGLENYPRYRLGGRLENYRGKTPLSDRAFALLQRLIKQVAENIERFDRQHSRSLHAITARPLEILALSSLSLEELAAQDGPSRIEGRVRRFKLLRNTQNNAPPAASTATSAREEK